MNALRHIILCVAAVLLSIATAHARDGADADADIPPLPERKVNYYKGYKWRVDEAGDSMIVYYLTDIYIYPPLRFATQKEKQRHDRLARNVKLLLPYAKLVSETLIETYEYISTLPTTKDREAYLKKMEKEIFDQYKPVFRKFSRTQARLLIKLIQRETHQSSYDIVKAFMGSLRAAFWQGFGKLFGVSLKSDYDPASNAEDAEIERLAVQAELGMI